MSLGSFKMLLTKCVYKLCIFNIGIMVRMYVNGLGDWSSIPGRVIPKT